MNDTIVEQQNSKELLLADTVNENEDSLIPVRVQCSNDFNSFIYAPSLGK